MVVLVGVGALAVSLLRGGDEPGGTEVTAGIGEAAGTGEMAATGVTAGEQHRFTVPEDGQWELVIEVPAGMLVLDVRGLDGFDPVAALIDAGGQEIDRNDDRSMEQLERWGGGVFDSLIEREVPAGTYRVVVTGFAGQGGAGELTLPVVGG